MNDQTDYQFVADGLGGGGLPTMYAYNMGGSGQNYYYDRTNPQNEHWAPVPAATPTGPVPAPAPPPKVPAHLQFSAGTIGSTIMLQYGRGRLPGQIIWAPGIDATNNVLDTSLLTFAAVYCEPIDVTEPLEISRMWANGTQFYDRDAGGVLAVPNIDSEAAAQLQACVNSLACYYGGEDQLPNPTMEAYLGAGNVPSYKGLRMVVFQDFPLLIANNSVPNVSIEWRRTDTTLVNVADAMLKLIEHVDYRVETKSIFGAASIEGIDDLCAGLTITSQESLISHFQAHRNIYNYQIIEGDPIRIVRREVASSLVIDYSINERDICVTSPGAPAVTFSRANPSEFPIGILLSYPDVDNGYDIKVAPATFDGSPPGNATGASSVVLNTQSAYITDATTARTRAFKMLFNLRSYAARAAFMLDDIRPQVGDTIAITTSNNDVYVVLVDQAVYTKERGSQINSMILLNSAGANVAGDGGNDGGAGATRIYWPEACVAYDMIPTASRIWSSFRLELNYNTNPPARRITATKRGQYTTSSFNSDFPAARMFEDNTYVYWLSNTEISIFRVPKDAFNVTTAIQKLSIPAFSGTYRTSKTLLQFLSVVRDGKLYVAWDEANGVSADQRQLVVVDLVAWSPTGFTSTKYADNSDAVDATALAITDNGTVLIAAANLAGSTGALYDSSLGSLGTWHTTSLSVNVASGTSQGDFAYFIEYNYSASGLAARVSNIVVVDCSSGVSETVVDLTGQDANIVSISQRAQPIDIFCSPTHLFVPCNYTRDNTSDSSEREYLARLDLGTLAAAGGKFIGQLIYADHELFPFHGRYFDGKLYISMLGESYEGRVLIVGEDLSPASATLYPTPSYSAPINNSFAAAINIYVNELKSGNLFYASTEPGEPPPNWATTGSFPLVRNAGHSVWYSFTAPSTNTFTVLVDDYAHEGTHSIEIYTGADVAALTPVASTPPANSSGGTFLAFAATAGVEYMISIRHDMTGAFNGFAGSTPADGPTLERLGNYTISISL